MRSRSCSIGAACSALHHLGYVRHVAAALEADAQDPSTGQEALPCGMAYRPGWEMGRKETFDVMARS